MEIASRAAEALPTLGKAGPSHEGTGEGGLDSGEGDPAALDQGVVNSGADEAPGTPLETGRLDARDPITAPGAASNTLDTGGVGPWGGTPSIALTTGQMEPTPLTGEVQDTTLVIGGVETSNRPDPSKSYIRVKDSEKAVVGEKSTLILHAVDTESKPYEGHLQSLVCKLVSKITGTRESCSVEQKGHNQYEISYQPTIKGRHQLHITVEGRHIRGSPFSLTVTSPVEKLGIPILTIGSVEGPLGVAMNRRGEVVVTEWEGHCVSVFSPSGEKLRSFGTRGSNQGEFDSPHGVAVDGEGNILVADRDNHRIQKFSPEGQFLTAVGTKGSEPLQFSYPVEVAFNATNDKIYVADEGDHHIQVLNSDLTFSSTFGKKGGGQGRLNRPCGIACDSTGKVYVADTDNHRVQVFSAEGKFLTMFGSRGHDQGEMDTPVSIAVDTSGMVYVVERNNFRISVFTSDGVVVSSFGKRGKGPGEFSWLSGVAVDNSGIVYVCDSVSNVVKAF
jgi:tripartite motif-containing protein 2/3/tripartite motif-containing protein 71